jgi:hypothetical protein
MVRMFFWSNAHRLGHILYFGDGRSRAREIWVKPSPCSGVVRGQCAVVGAKPRFRAVQPLETCS